MGPNYDGVFQVDSVNKLYKSHYSYQTNYMITRISYWMQLSVNRAEINQKNSTKTNFDA